jgi:hypothetical protein
MGAFARDIRFSIVIPRRKAAGAELLDKAGFPQL